MCNADDYQIGKYAYSSKYGRVNIVFPTVAAESNNANLADLASYIPHSTYLTQGD